MALSDPQSVTLNSTAVSLPRVSVGDYSATYMKDDGYVTLWISHQPNKTKTRRVAKLSTVDVAADPLMAGVNRLVPFAVSIVIESPVAGKSLASQKDAVTALLTALTASSGALLTKILGGES